MVCAVLMMLAFVVDQAQQLCCAWFRAVWLKLGSKRLLGERMRALFYTYALMSMRSCSKPSCMVARGRAPSFRWIPRKLSPCLL